MSLEFLFPGALGTTYLDMERQQMEAYLDGDYETDIEIYLRSQQNMIELADFLTSGLLAR